MLSSLRDLLSRKKEAEEDSFTEASISAKLYKCQIKVFNRTTILLSGT